MGVLKATEASPDIGAGCGGRKVGIREVLNGVRRMDLEVKAMYAMWIR